MMRSRWRLAVTLAVAVAAASASCASPGMPPGGPPDTAVPVLTRILPDSNAVNVRTPAIVLVFDEVINERSQAAGAQTSSGVSPLNSVVQLSPSDGRDEVVWRRAQLEVRPRRGFRPNTAYRVRILPGLADLRGNRTEEALEFVFSTGATLATGEVRGVLFDWTSGKPAANARVDVFTAADTMFRWSARTDSSGRFTVRDLMPGQYELRAWVDANSDRRISFREISDEARVTLADSARVELYAFVRDTMPPRVETLELLDSTALRVKFERGIVADWDGEGAVLLASDSSVIALGGPFIPAARYDSLAKARAPAATDSAVSSPIQPDTVRVTNTRPAPRGEAAIPSPIQPDTIRMQLGDSARRDSAAADTADRLPPPEFKRTVPVQSWTAPLRAPLAPGTYMLRITRASGLNGRPADTQRELRVTPPRPASDTTAARRARADSTRPPARP